MLAARRGDRRNGLDDPAVATQHRDVHQRGRVVGKGASGRVGVEPSLAVGRERHGVETASRHDDEVRSVFTGQTGDLLAALPITQQ